MLPVSWLVMASKCIPRSTRAVLAGLRRGHMALWFGLLLVIAVGFVGQKGVLAASSVVETENVRAELIAETATIPADGTLWVSLRLDLRPGWHTYWRNPGDSGEPTRIVWHLPAGVEASEILWLPPKRIPFGPLVNFGYEGRADHLVRLTVPQSWLSDAPLRVQAEASWLACEQICIPEQGAFELTWMPASTAGNADTALTETFARLRGALPAQAAWPTSFRIHDGRLVLTAAVPAEDDIEAAVFFPYEWGYVEPAGAQSLTRLHDGGLVLSLQPGSRAAEVIEGVLVLAERTATGSIERAFEITARRAKEGGAAGIQVGEGGANDRAAALGLGPAILFALLGGLILNLMPCVFPVLSIKAIGLIHHGSVTAGQRRLSGLAYTLGVLAFMGLVAALLIVLKGGGAQIGWGFQLQSPAFVAAMAVILFLLGLSLAGWFSFGASVMGWGSGLASRSDATGSFFTGALAALVATPCTAPFMGAAIGFALSQPWGSALLVMLALGLGLALPYLLLSFVPALARWLPKPGAWMDKLKQFLAFPLFASAAWLVWVLSVQVGPTGVFVILMAGVAAALAIWVERASGEARGGWRMAGRAVAIVLAVGVGLLALFTETLKPAPGATIAATAGRTALGRAQPFSQARLDQLLEAGTPVFVNMTAAWCITCKVNERLALSSERIAQVFAERGVVYLQGDWTNRDPAITRYLESFGRSGVPLYVFYPGSGYEAVVLPQLLTEAIVIDAIASPAKLSLTPSPTDRRS